MISSEKRGPCEHAESFEPARLGKDVDQLLASDEVKMSLRKPARLAAAGFPVEIDEPTRRRLSPVAVKACSKLAAAWGLQTEQIAGLLSLTPGHYEELRESPECALLDAEQFTRAALLIEIFITLMQLFVGRLAFDWPRRANAGPLFRGVSPIDLMRNGVPAMSEVLGHLHALALGL